MNKIALIGIVLLLSGCASSGVEINDYTDRSVVYGWLDIDDVNGNTIYGSSIKQFSPPTKEPLLFLDTVELDGGYMFYYYGLPNGAFKFNSVSLQTCLGFVCGNSIAVYDFGGQGDTASIKITEPGAYYLGSFKLANEDTGFFERKKFKVTEAKGGPSKKEMLQIVLENAPNDHPIVAERIKASLAKEK